MQFMIPSRGHWVKVLPSDSRQKDQAQHDRAAVFEDTYDAEGRRQKAAVREKEVCRGRG